jgi:hypothetical protein
MCVPGGSRLIKITTKAKSFLMKLEYRKYIINSENRKLLGPQKYEKLHISLSAIENHLHYYEKIEQTLRR